MAVDAAAGGAGALASSEGVGEAGTMAEEAGGGCGAAADFKGDGVFTRERHTPPPHERLIHGFKSCLFCAVEQDADDVKTCTESRLTERAVARRRSSAHVVLSTGRSTGRMISEEN